MARCKKDVSEKYNAPFPSNLRTLMKIKSVNQEMLSAVTGKTRQTVSQYVNGISEPSYSTLVKIAEYFDVSTDYLLGKSKTMTPDISIQEMVQQTGLSEENIIRLIAWNNLESTFEQYDETSPKHISMICDTVENFSIIMKPTDFRDTVLEFSNCLISSYLNSPATITRSYRNFMASLFTWYKALRSNSEHDIYCKADEIDAKINEFGLITLTAEESAEHSLSRITSMLGDEIKRVSQNIIFSEIDD